MCKFSDIKLYSKFSKAGCEKIIGGKTGTKEGTKNGLILATSFSQVLPLKHMAEKDFRCVLKLTNCG